MDEHVELTRRRLLELGVALPIPIVLAACGGGGSDEATPPTTAATLTQERATTLAPTPACDDGDDPTPEQTEGPFFIPDSPERTNLREDGDGVDGTPFLLTGEVIATDCTPISGALLDFWHADDSGEYDNEGFKLRGHQFTDAIGTYRLETIVPGLYTGRTRHIHVKVQREGGSILTTQLYFPDEPGNEGDGLYDSALLMDIPGGGDARFDFVLS